MFHNKEKQELYTLTTLRWFIFGIIKSVLWPIVGDPSEHVDANKTGLKIFNLEM
jgi:hypothetical protein